VRRFRYEYGASPLHLAGAIASLAFAAWALAQAFDVLADPLRFGIWIGGSIVAHDVVLFPLLAALAALAGVAAGPEPSPVRRAAINHVRIPALLSGLALLVWFPLILRTGTATFERTTGLANDVYLERWLLLTAALFGGSAVLLALRARGLRRGGGEERM
jgi:hypothetical protein